MNFYIMLPSGEVGPVTYEVMEGYVESSMITMSTLIKVENSELWIPAGDLLYTKHLFDRSAEEMSMSQQKYNHKAPAYMYATWSRRVIAGGIDTMICLMLTILTAFFTSWFYFRVYPLNQTNLGILFLLNAFITSGIYFSWCESGKKQATLGKRMMAIYVCKENWERISFLRGLVRYLLFQLLAIFFWTIFITHSKQTLYDIFASVVVLKGKK